MHISDYKKQALAALKCNWGLAIGVFIVAGLLVPNFSSAFSFFRFFAMRTDADGTNTIFDLIMQSPKVYALDLLARISSIVIGFCVGSPIATGLSRFFLKMNDTGVGEFNDLFSGFKQWKASVLSNILSSLYIMLGFFLFIIPGIIFSLDYSMIPYVIADDPDVSAIEAMKRSKSMMRGNRWRLFVLHLSFLGWYLLSYASFGIGFLWFYPYIEASTAAFYRDIAGTKHKKKK